MWNLTDIPLAYFISFRSYGTWLHGDKRGSIDRYHNRYRSPYIPQNEKWRHHNEQRLKAKPLILRARQRKSIEATIRETCDLRQVTRHLKLYLTLSRQNATRQLRQAGLWPYPFSPWADGGSKRRLWNEQSVARAIDYVLNGQGDDLPDFDD